jgi:replicative DNA helicase
MLQDLTINDLEELIELSEIIYKKIYDSENSFNNIVKGKIKENNNEVYFLTNAFKLAKYIKLENTCEVIIYSHTFNQDVFTFLLGNSQTDIFGRKPIITGLKNLDKRVKMFKGEFVVIASRPMMGKTSFIAQLCNNQVKLNLGIGVYSLEQSKEDFYIKMLSQNTSIPISNLIKNDLDEEQMINLCSSFENLNNSFLFDKKNYTLKALISKIKKDFIFNKFDVIYIDYLQLIKSASSLEYRYLELNQISRELKILAKELDILIITTSELNRNVENRIDKRPLLYDLRDSGTIEEDADKVIFLYRGDIYREREDVEKANEAKSKGEDYKSRFIIRPVEPIELIIAKQNNGAVGTVNINFLKSFARFCEKEDETSPIEVIYISEEKKIPDIF